MSFSKQNCASSIESDSLRGSHEVLFRDAGCDIDKINAVVVRTHDRAAIGRKGNAPTATGASVECPELLPRLCVPELHFAWYKSQVSKSLDHASATGRKPGAIGGKSNAAEPRVEITERPPEIAGLCVPYPCF